MLNLTEGPRKSPAFHKQDCRGFQKDLLPRAKLFFPLERRNLSRPPSKFTEQIFYERDVEYIGQEIKFNGVKTPANMIDLQRGYAGLNPVYIEWHQIIQNVGSTVPALAYAATRVYMLYWHGF